MNGPKPVDRLKASLGILLVVLLAACSSAPVFDTDGVDYSLSPKRVVASPQSASGKQVRWGGIILGTSRQQDRSQLEVLAYPLDERARPQTTREPVGRFLIEQAAPLDPASYREGRPLTTVGTVTGIRTGRAGDTDYTYPLIRARQLHLWRSGSDGVSVGGYIGFGVGGGSDTDGEIGFGF